MSSKFEIIPERYYAFDDKDICMETLMNETNPCKTREEARKYYPKAKRIIRGSTIINHYRSDFPGLKSRTVNALKGAIRGAGYGGLIGLGAGVLSSPMGVDTKVGPFNAGVELKPMVPAIPNTLDETNKVNKLNTTGNNTLNYGLAGAGLGALIGGIRGAMK